MSDPDAWPDDRIDSEVAFTLSPMGRLRREEREIAFALEIQRLRAWLDAALTENAIRQQARREALEEAAKVCDSRIVWWTEPSHNTDPIDAQIRREESAMCAHHIRGLTGKEGGEND